MQRAPSRELARGILDGAASVYLERFLNMPRQPRPEPNGGSSRGSNSTDDLLGHFDRQQQVDETGQTVADLLAAGQQREVTRALGTAVLREDAGFHSFQIYEAALRLVDRFDGRPEADDVADRGKPFPHRSRPDGAVDGSDLRDGRSPPSR